MGAVRLEKARAQLAGRIALQVVWRPFELRPEMPRAGLPLSSLGFEPAEFDAMQEHLLRSAAAEGIEFARRTLSSLLVNTHRALAASLYAQAEEPDRFEAFHHALFRGIFGEKRNIGEPPVLRDIAIAAGLDATRMDAALEAGTGDPALREAAAAARQLGITAIPAFVFGGDRLLVGAHPTATLVRAAEEAAAAAHEEARRQ